ncbi:MAG: TRAP transporter small permease [Oceanospirillaceae bacterium]|nr:TRAP transporter small permease [Oceanospirillaceae bacterium]
MSFSTWLHEHYKEKGPVMWLAFALEALAALALVLLMFLTCADVIGRYFFSNAVDGAVEMTEIAIAIIVFAEIPVITWRGAHVVVDIMDNIFGNALVTFLEGLSNVVIAAAFYFLGNRIFVEAARSMRRNEVTEHLQLPIGYVIQYIGVMCWIAAAGTLVWGLYRLYRRHGAPAVA